MGLKFSDFSLQNNLLKYILIIISIIAIVALQWLAVPIIFIIYIVLSSFSKQSTGQVKKQVKEAMDITV
jgi:CDP-diacylglycerol--serine O-phosphatidyltransferase